MVQNEHQKNSGAPVSATWPSVSAFQQHLVPWLSTDPKLHSFEPSRLSPRKVAAVASATLAATLMVAPVVAKAQQPPCSRSPTRWGWFVRAFLTKHIGMHGFSPEVRMPPVRVVASRSRLVVGRWRPVRLKCAGSSSLFGFTDDTNKEWQSFF